MTKKRTIKKGQHFSHLHLLIDIGSMRRNQIFTQNKKDWATSLFVTMKLFNAILAITFSVNKD
ncbi:hypothetical protein CTN02_01340 [Lysinibacillus sphaericus]|nr:hypothetical protein [Lysinibacillus sphaericus]MBG9755508.1 hypothetical protein [Lysinibacillus sphaericus]PIJ99613.1 hypothetical protein CTN02_01340 [Lysinibacillus sphaericus]